MKKFRFLLLDAGPIIKLFELGIWDQFIARCDITVCRTVVEEAKWASQEFTDVQIDLDDDQREGRICIEEVDLSVAKKFHDKFNASYRTIIHDGEKETLAFLFSSSEEWLLCTGDGSVFRTLGLLGKAQQGVSRPVLYPLHLQCYRLQAATLPLPLPRACDPEGPPRAP